MVPFLSLFTKTATFFSAKNIYQYYLKWNIHLYPLFICFHTLVGILCWDNTGACEIFCYNLKTFKKRGTTIQKTYWGKKKKWETKMSQSKQVYNGDFALLWLTRGHVDLDPDSALHLRCGNLRIVFVYLPVGTKINKFNFSYRTFHFSAMFSS